MVPNHARYQLRNTRTYERYYTLYLSENPLSSIRQASFAEIDRGKDKIETEKTGAIMRFTEKYRDNPFFLKFAVDFWGGMWYKDGAPLPTRAAR